MQKKTLKRGSGIWLTVLLLFMCVAATTFAMAGQMNQYQMDDSGAISLLSGKVLTAPAATAAPTPAQTPNTVGTGVPDGPSSTYAPGFEASDDNTVWTTDTQVEIFKVSYENGQQVITINSSDGDKVIAPGTENSYTFKLKNTGNVALDYTVEVDAYFTPGDITIPVTARLNRYDGKWLAGGSDFYADIPALDTAADSATLGAGKYTYYTLDWLWPYESGDDELDTMLGNLAVEQDLTLSIVIKTTATAAEDPDADPGITPPVMGDVGRTWLWIALAVGSFVMLLLLIFSRDKKDKRSKTGGAQN